MIRYCYYSTTTRGSDRNIPKFAFSTQKHFYNRTFLFSTSAISSASSPSGTDSTSGPDPTLNDELLDEDLDEELALAKANQPSASVGTAKEAKLAASAETKAAGAGEVGEDSSEEDSEDTFNVEALAAEEELVPEEIASAVATPVTAADPRKMSAANLLSGLLDRPPPRAEKRTVIPFGYDIHMI